MDSEVKNKIAREIAARRSAALARAERRKGELYARIPALAELDRKAAALSAEHVRSRLTGGEGIADYEAQIEAIAARKAELMAGADIAPHFTCAKCGDTGRVNGALCTCFQNRLIAANLANANLSVTSTHERFDNFDLSFYSKQRDERYGVSPYDHMTSILRRCKRFADEFETPQNNLLLVGTPGLGKTFLSSAIAHQVLEGGHTVIYLSAGEFCTRIQANRFGGEELAPYYDADLLILDDLGTEFKTGLTVSVLGDVIDRRLRAGKKMVFSTNLTLGDLEKQYSARIISRFMGGFDYLQFIGSDIRLQKRKR